VQLRGLLASHEDLVRERSAPEKKYDAEFKVVFDAIRQLVAICVVQRLMLHVSRFTLSR
jgi:hypothetical protein